MKVRILAAQRLLFEGEAKEVVMPGADGEFSVRDLHQACVYALRQGQIKTVAKDPREPRGKFFIKRGIALVEWSRLNIIVEEF